MMIRGFFTTFLMKHRLGIFGFGKTAFESGLSVVLSILTKLTNIGQFLKAPHIYLNTNVNLFQDKTLVNLFQDSHFFLIGCRIVHTFVHIVFCFETQDMLTL